MATAPQENEYLRQAIIWGREEECRTLIAADANVNATDSDGDPFLQVASLYNRPDIVQMLLDAGAKINGKNKRGVTALHVAAANTNLGAFRVLLDAGADVHALTKTGDRPLHWAATGGNLEICQMLVAAGVEVNGITEDGQTPLHRAVYNNHFAATGFFIESGVDVNVLDHSGENAVMHAAASGNFSIMRILKEAGAELHYQNRACRSALHKALNGGHNEMAEALMNDRLSLISPDIIGVTPLHVAVKNCAPEIVARILDGGGNVSAVTDDFAREAPLHWAAKANRVENCRLLVAAGANPSQESVLGRDDYLTPFQAAVKSGAVDAARYFVLECGEDLAQRTAGKKTLTQLAGKSDAMKLALRSLKTEMTINQSVGEDGSGDVRPATKRATSMSSL